MEVNECGKFLLDLTCCFISKKEPTEKRKCHKRVFSDIYKTFVRILYGQKLNVLSEMLEYYACYKLQRSECSMHSILLFALSFQALQLLISACISQYAEFPTFLQ